MGVGITREEYEQDLDSARAEAMENGRILAMHALQGHDYRKSESMRIAADFFIDEWRDGVTGKAPTEPHADGQEGDDG